MGKKTTIELTEDERVFLKRALSALAKSMLKGAREAKTDQDKSAAESVEQKIYPILRKL